ncbi:CDGSH iron-sulfur domain-containing protein 1-like [Amphiura filiformis]|uniref:CDGSH iron-sulfur domain-containing protein 1-like n=1 Tax=Amphiura filiformis TaxID=82378 RepID=UPI003B226237
MEGMDLVRWIPTVGGLAAILYVTVQHLRGGCDAARGKGQVNQTVQKDTEKVVHSFDIEDLGDKQAFCRCWKSSKFPYCDGSHNKHNKETGDNVGPLCLSKKSDS